MNKERENIQVSIPIKKSVLKKLRENLPAGFYPELKKKLEEKGHSFTKQYIYQVLDPNDKRKNEAIIDAAMELVEELSLIREQKEKRILELAK
jgi:hypothetical protein